MNRQLEELARILAKRPYAMEIMRDETTGGDPIFLVTHPELPGCLAQGETIEEAQENLEDATYEYISSLLEDELPVPDPKLTATTTSLP